MKRWSKMLVNVTHQKATEDGALNMPPYPGRRLQMHRLKLKVPNYPKLCILVEYYAGRAVPKA